MISYIPKATIQATIGSLPLTMKLECGNLVLTIAVLSVLIAAPFGTIGMDFLTKSCLKKS